MSPTPFISVSVCYLQCATLEDYSNQRNMNSLIFSGYPRGVTNVPYSIHISINLPTVCNFSRLKLLEKHELTDVLWLPKGCHKCPLLHSYQYQSATYSVQL